MIHHSTQSNSLNDRIDRLIKNWQKGVGTLGYQLGVNKEHSFKLIINILNFSLYQTSSLKIYRCLMGIALLRTSSLRVRGDQWECSKLMTKRNRWQSIRMISKMKNSLGGGGLVIGRNLCLVTCRWSETTNFQNAHFSG